MYTTGTMSVTQRFRLHEAIVLAQYDLADADRIVVFATPDAGKIAAKVKGAKRLSSKLSSLVEPATHIEAQFVEGRTSFLILTGGRILAAPEYSTLEAMSVRDHCLEVARHSFVEDQKDPVVFSVVREALRQVSVQKNDRLLMTQIVYDCAISYALGQTPQLHTCLVCDVSLQRTSTWLSRQFGGGLCRVCQVKDAGARRLSPELFGFWRFMEHRFAVLPLAQAMRPSVRMSAAQAQEGCDLFYFWLSGVFQSSFQTASWQAEVMRIA